MFHSTMNARADIIESGASVRPEVRRTACACWLAILLLFARTTVLGATVDFGRDIQPLFEQHCYKCHGPDKEKGGLRLDVRESAFKAAESGDFPIVAGDPGKSKILQLIKSADKTERMPSKAEPLAADKIQLLQTWIAEGAVWPVTAGPASDPAKKDYWAFKPVARPFPPTVANSRWARNPVDRFVLAKLEAQGLFPSPPAPRSELIRRLSFDLRGLPPTVREIEEFNADPSPQAYEQLVDRFLAAPEFGERRGLDWLDLVRYSESEGFEYDRHLPDAWRYRDYVIDSFNRDKPFNQFLTEQIAGDETAPESHEALAAAIFHRLGPVRRNAGNPELVLSRNEVLTERTDIIGAAFLGLTVGCARCHNHKFDPIPQQDYYRLQAYLAATQERDLSLASLAERQSWTNSSKALTTKLAQLKKLYKDAEGERRFQLEAEIEDLEGTLPPALPTIPTIQNGERTEIHVLKRGDWDRKGEQVGPRGLTVLVPEMLAEDKPDVGQPRTRLAQWLTDPSHPLTARVIVNRIWLHHFGQGIVKTPNDFGVNGGRPSHPELLDWMAAELVARGWQMKALHRLILLSSTYQQSSAPARTTVFSLKDPDNRLLWRFNRRRLAAEEIRDAMLAVSGQLSHHAGGPSVMVPVDPELVHLLYKPSQWQATPNVQEQHRRSIYLIAKRNLRLPFMEVFDQPALLTSCARRESSTHAPQALELLNGKMANDLAGAFAARLRTEAGPRLEAQVRLAYELATGRSPTPGEAQIATAFVREQSLTEFALAMFNLNDSLYVH